MSGVRASHRPNRTRPNGIKAWALTVDQIIIATTDPDKWIELSDAEPKGVATPVDTYLLTIQLRELRASTRPLDAYNDYARDGRRLAKVFAEMAKEWRGWKGEKFWSTTDSEVTLKFTHDRVSRVRVHVEVKTLQPRIGKLPANLPSSLAIWSGSPRMLRSTYASNTAA